MNYIVVDLEWNQAMSSKSSVFNKLPIHLLGEIIEIGAVKVKDGRVADTYSALVNPGRRLEQRIIDHIEEFMLDIMYEIPKDDNIGRVTITEEYVEKKGGPLIEMRGLAAIPEHTEGSL